MIREVLKYPDKKLKQKSKEVIKFDEELHMLLDDMYETMINKNGIGLAAIQVGVPLNVLIMLIPKENDEQNKEDLIEAINPKIVQANGLTVYTEGCLSVPEYYEDVERAKNITVEFRDCDGNLHVNYYEDLHSIAFQHEMDHLKGTLFVERLSILKRKKFEKEWKKRLKEKKV